MSHKIEFAGVDGCPSGWSIAIIRDRILSLHRIDQISQLSTILLSHSIIFVDMPIGLTDAPQGRICEREAKRHMPANYKSTIFISPCKSATYAYDFDSANALQRKVTGLGLSIQAWNMAKKMRELNNSIMAGELADYTIYEAHPEMNFAQLNGGQYPPHKKKTTEGIAQRMGIIEQYVPNANSIVQEFITRTKRKEIKIDDVLDSICLAISAQLAHIYGTISFPEISQINEFGMQMRISLPHIKYTNE